MPPATKSSSKGSNQTKNLSEKQIRRIWGELKAPLLLERLRVLQPTARWSASGHQLIGCCPYHDETGPSFRIYLDRGYAKCFGGSCEKFIWNPIELWSKLKGCGLADALADLRQLFGLKFLNTNSGTQLRAWERNQLIKRRVMALCHDELINAINLPNDPNYAVAQGAVQYLLNTRQLPVSVLHALPMVGVMPPLARILDALKAEAEEENLRRQAEAAGKNERFERFISLEEEARAYMQQAAGWAGALVFRLDVTPDTIGRLKLRRPDSKDFIILNDAYEEDLGFFGLGWPLYRSLLGSQQKYVPGVHLVEGEFDALSIMARQTLAGGPNFVILSVGGGAGGDNIDQLYHFGFSETYLVGDAPHNKGDELVEKWLPHIKRLRVKIFVGYGAFPGAGDPDEVVLRYGLTAVQSAFLNLKDKSCFVNPQEWVFERAQPEIEAIEESDLRYRVEVASTWGRLLKNSVECDAYIEFCHKAFGLPASQLKKEIVAKEEDEYAFILRIVSVLTSIFSVVGQRSHDKDRRLYLWHKAERRMVQVALADDSSAERELGTTLGPIYQFFAEKVGVPSFLEPSEAERAGGIFLQKKEVFYRWYLRQALVHMSYGAPDFDTARHLGQGIHVRRDATGTTRMYLVNGKDVYLGTFDAAQDLHWQLLDGPSHQGYIFDVGLHSMEPAWLKNVSSVEDLKRAESLDPRDCWNRLHAVLDAGWRFKNHSITAEFLTTHLLATTVCNAFRRQVMVAFHADTSAGKSKLVMGLISGTDFQRIHLIAAAVGIPNFSPAGIRQSMNDKVRPLCLDEFEDDGTGDKKSRTITETLEMFRNLVGEDNTITYGTRNNVPVVYRLNFFVFLAAINRARKVQDANRMVTVFMERIEGREDPVNVITNALGEDGVRQLRDDLSLVLLPHVAAIQQCYREIEAEFGQPGNKPASVETRFFEALYPSMALMKFLGRDYKAFGTQFCEANKDSITQGSTHTDSQALFDWILYSPQLKMRVGDNRDRNDASVLQLLATPETRNEINFSGSGLYYDEHAQLLIVNWTQAVQKVLVAHPRYSKETNIHNLRELANRAPNAMKPPDLESSGALNRLRATGLSAMPIAHLSAYYVGHIIRGLSANMVQPPSTASEKPKEKVVNVDDGEFAA